MFDLEIEVKALNTFNNNDINVDIVIVWAGPQQRSENIINLFNISSGLYDEHRDNDNGELKYTLRSIALNVQWINNIFILVNGIIEAPNYIPLSLTNRIHIINRCKLMPNGTCPTRNSFAVFHYVHHLLELSEHYIMGEDDIMIGRKVTINNFFYFDSNTNKYLPYIYSKTTRYGYFAGNESNQFHRLYVKQDRKDILLLNNSIPQSSCPCPHFWYPMLKSVAISLEKQYPAYYKFVASHKKGRYSSLANGISDKHNSQEEEFHGIAQWELDRTKKGIFKNIEKYGYTWWDEVDVSEKGFQQTLQQRPIFININEFSNKKDVKLKQLQVFYKYMEILFPIISY